MMLKLSNSKDNSCLSSFSRSFDSEAPAKEATRLYSHKINIDSLINICTSRLEINPSHRKALFIRASSYMKKRMFEEAIEDCHRLLNLDKRNVGAYYIIGCAYDKLQEVEIAIENFTIVIELDPTHVNALLARGACLNRIGQCKEALDDYDNALKLDEEKGKFKRSRQDRRKGGAMTAKAPISEEDLVKPN